MMKFSRKGMSLAVVVAVAAGSYMQPAWSADAEIEEVVVTGSSLKDLLRMRSYRSMC
jgi:hypothetical protein